MEYSHIQLTDLPDEILMTIFKQLYGVEILYSLIGVNKRLNTILHDPIFTNVLTLFNYRWDDFISSFSYSMLNRFCSQILPQIHHKIGWLNLESSSMAHILLSTNYPNLYRLGLYGLEIERAKYLFTVHGAIRFANYYQDHMVLQRAPERSIVWGYSDAFDTPISLSMNNKVYQTMSSSIPPANSMDASIWSVSLDPQIEEGPFQVKVTRPLTNGTLETITLNDILFGDVWFCGGQSNMRFPVNEMFNGSVEITNANNYPKIRLFTLVDTQASTPQEELVNTGMPWSVASNITLTSGYVSAVCWLYGRMIHEALGGRPIGLTHVSWAGTYIEYWTPPEALKECNITGSEENIHRKDSEADSEVNAILNNSVIYNAMVHPFTRMVIKGSIWYQGEQNSNYNRDIYNCTFPKMIQAWRNIWYTRTNFTTDPTFPFGFVQIATGDPTGQVVGGFPWIRWHETFDVGSVPNNKVPNVFMAVTVDLRDDANTYHPRDKLDVGYRLSRSGLAVAYDYKNITFLGPIISDFSVASDSSKVNVTYSNIASPAIELRNPDGFEVCCADKDVCSSNDAAWEVAPASRIEGALLTISLAVPSQCVSKPINGLRYLWKETPCLFKQAAVYNSEDPDLPAGPYIHYF